MEAKKRRKQLTFEERKYIEKVYKSKTKQEICSYLGIHIATLSRELNRCTGEYRAKEAQLDKERKKRKSVDAMNEKKQNYVKQYSLQKQIETCLKMKPKITAEEIAEVIGVDTETVNQYLAGKG